MNRLKTPKGRHKIGKREEMVHDAYTKMLRSMEKMRIFISLWHFVLRADDCTYELVEKVLAWHEKVMTHRIG